MRRPIRIIIIIMGPAARLWRDPLSSYVNHNHNHDEPPPPGLRLLPRLFQLRLSFCGCVLQCGLRFLHRFQLGLTLRCLCLKCRRIQQQRSAVRRRDDHTECAIAIDVNRVDMETVGGHWRKPQMRSEQTCAHSERALRVYPGHTAAAIDKRLATFQVAV